MYSALNRHIDPLLASIAKDGGLDQYRYLIDTFRRTDTTRDLQFQRTYRSYWQMGAARLSEDFCQAYFGLLEEMKTFERTDVSRIAIRLYNLKSNSKGDRKLHFSFSTKMVHMLHTDTPVYDSLVAQFYFLAEEGASFDDRLKSRLESYQFLVMEYRRVLQEDLLAPSIAAFRARFSLADAFTDTKIIDTLIWRFAAMLSGGALKTGLVRYS
ncbi:MAG TPA: hypothetical protein VMI94_29120 [Bryobacteraceae bacterium]|nr:hypothetical protein [Bryobacteraceae bacterium]